MAGGGPVASTTIAAGGGVGGQLQAALPTTVFQLDPTLAAAVNSAAHHTQQASFTIRYQSLTKPSS